MTIAIGGLLGAAGGLVSGLGLGSVDPAKEAARITQINAWKSAAIAGDAVAFARLRCAASDQTAAPLVAEMGYPDNRNDGKPPCSGFASSSAIGYAQAAVLEVKARQGVAGLAGQVALGATQVGVAANPGVFAGTVGSGLGSSAAAAIGVPPIVLYLALGAAVYFVAKKVL